MSNLPKQSSPPPYRESADQNPTMDEKRTYLQSRPLRRNRPVLLLLLLGSFVFSLWHLLSAREYSLHQVSYSEKPASSATTNKLVPLEAHIISKCPDTRDCLKMLILPTMQKAYEKVDFKLSYIGTPTANDGVECKHGPSECMGNILELCAAELYPDPKIYLGFTMCITRDYHSIPERSLIEDCALEHAIDFKALNDCATKDDGAFGIGMLRDSIRRTSEAGVTKSCTVRLNEEIYCIRDDGEWYDCPHGANVNDLVIAIEKLYRSSNS